jgi:ketosteroid isomerase-like protein
MSRSPEDVVRSGYERFNAGDRDPIPELWHSDAAYIPDRRDPEPAPYSGLEAITGVFRSWVDAYPDLRVDPLEIRAAGKRVFVWARFHGQGATRWVAIDMERAQVYTVEQAKILQVEEYFDRDEALKAQDSRSR